MLDIENIPNINKNPLKYVFEDLNFKHQEDTLWLEFGVYSGKTINYISTFTSDKVYGFDSFEGLPEDWRPGFDKGAFNMNGYLPEVNYNVELIKGWFDETLDDFLKEHDKKISFIHIDCDIYSSTKYILNRLKGLLTDNCIIVFDELVNYDGYENGELKAFYEFTTYNNLKYRWIGMDGTLGLRGPEHENVALILNPINKCDIVINSHKNFTIALNILLKSLKENKLYEYYNFIVIIGESSSFSIEKIGNITYVYETHNSIDFTGLLTLVDHPYIRKSDICFYMHDTCITGKNFLSILDNINLDEITTMSMKDLPSQNIGFYRYDFLDNNLKALRVLKNFMFDENAINAYKMIGIYLEDFFFRSNKDHITPTNKNIIKSNPYDYYNTGNLRNVTYIEHFDLYKTSVNFVPKLKYNMNV